MAKQPIFMDRLTEKNDPAATLVREVGVRG